MAIFSASVIKNIDKDMNKDIKNAIVGNKDFIKEIKKTLQQANRRAQNIEKSGLASPSYQALILEGRTGYSKFSITGLDALDANSFSRIKYEYAKALEYLKNPTSSATGARQYIKYIANKYKVPFDVANAIVKNATSTEFHDDKIPLFNYKVMIDDFMTDSKEEKKNMNSSANEYAEELEKNINDYSNQLAEEIHDITNQLEQDFKNAFKIK